MAGSVRNLCFSVLYGYQDFPALHYRRRCAKKRGCRKYRQQCDTRYWKCVISSLEAVHGILRLALVNLKACVNINFSSPSVNKLLMTFIWTIS